MTVATYCLELLAPEIASVMAKGRVLAGRADRVALKASAARLPAERGDSVDIEIEKSRTGSE